MTEILALTDDHLLGQGRTRWVYCHPANPDRCIKIPFPDCTRLKAIRREARYLRMYKRRGVEFTHLPEFHGYVETTRGEGAVFTLIRDADGAPSPTMRTFLADRGDLEAAHAALRELREFLLANRILFHDINASNLLAQRNDALRLVMTDGIGNSDFIKINDWIPFLARRKIRRKWPRVLRMLPPSTTGPPST